MKNWRTTLFGALSAAIYAVLTYFQSGGVSAKDAAIAAGLAAVGIVAKDAGVSGTEK